MNRVFLGLPAFITTVVILLYLHVARPPASQPTEVPLEDQPLPAVPDGGSLPHAAEMEEVARSDPVAFLETCLRRFQREVHGYRMVMQKQERIDGGLQPLEVIEVVLQEEPYRVFMRWREGARNAERVLFVEGENDGQLLARPNGALRRAIAGDVVAKPVDGPMARQSGRVPLNKFGIRKTMERTRASWILARDQGTLQVEYLGEHRIKEANDRLCYQFHRVCAQPEGDGVLEQMIWVDKETWLQIGTVVKGEGGQLMGAYYYRDIQLNPEIKSEQFQRAALMP
jgi:hypothetical protein